MQIPLLLVESVSKGIYLYLDLRNYTAHGRDFHPRLEQTPKVKFMPESAPESPFFYLRNKKPNLAFLSGRLTSSSDLASHAISRCSSVQRSFFCGDVIAITSWAPDVVNLVRPYIGYSYIILGLFALNKPPTP